MTKEYYQSLMSVIEYVGEGHYEIAREKGEELAGEYWPRIFRLFKDERIGVAISDGSFDITQPQFLSSIYADCVHAIEDIEKREADRALANKSTEAHMKYTRIALWLSAIAILMSVASSHGKSSYNRQNE
ncbi:MAG: hypothetical protein ACLR8Y_01910 [Alistipes indistinctus]